ncbi:trimeric intracellular cation channel family protein [Hathewaya massiliensis]|uniref:trimeric intracellular cation channel family protein n=1 Tax=Hathewaya massiliensis TaxID=1964382 RepID=UPI001158296F|nr:trimeric intracellular cation channel family protein [Hathewaya massiliensis]
MLILNIFEIIGTIAFAISGALVGMQKKLDLFGITFLGIITAVGGGIFRDMILGNFPPTTFRKPTYCIISIVSSIATFYLYPVFINRYEEGKKRTLTQEDIKNNKYMTKEQLLNIITKYDQMRILKNVIVLFDAIGLGAFTAVGANLAYYHKSSNMFLVACMGLITGVGGGILRDTFVQDTPMVFKKDIYAVASILGAVVLYLCNYYGNSSINSLYICAILTVGLRLLSIKLKLNLPIFNSDKYNISL